MHKLSLGILSVVLVLLLLIGSALLFLFSPVGNDALKPYLKKKIETIIGIPVNIDTFSLNQNTVKLNISSKEQLSTYIGANYKLLDQSYKGLYHSTANDFVYEDVKLRQADIKGHFWGDREDLFVDGNGTALDAALSYSVHLVQDAPQKIVAKMKAVSLEEVLALSGQPALAKGTLDIDINMQNMSESSRDEYGHVVLHKAIFDEALVEKMYDITLPKESYVSATVNAKLEDGVVKFDAKTKSNLFTADIKNASLDVSTKAYKADFIVDTKDMRILTENKLRGVFKLTGKAEGKGKSLQIKAQSDSLGGELSFYVDKAAKINLKNVGLAKLMFLVGQSTEADAKLSGSVVLKDKKKKEGNFDILVSSLVLGNVASKEKIHLKGDFDISRKTKASVDVLGMAEQLNISINDKVLSINTKALELQKALGLAGLAQYVTGTLNADIELSDIKNVDGSFSIKSNKLVTQAKVMKKTTGKPLHMAMIVTSKGTVQNANISADANIRTSMGEVDLKGMRFDTKTQALSTDYDIHIADLQKAKMLTGANIYGEMTLQGKITKQKALNLTGATSSVGGNIQYTLQDNIFKANIDKVPLENIFALMGQDKIVLGLATGVVQKNIKSDLGSVDIDIENFSIKPAPWTRTATMLLGKDPSRILFSSTKLKANIKGDIITYSVDALSQKASISLSQGVLNKAKDTHTAKFKLVYEKNTITGKIQGSIDNPKVSIDAKSLMNNRMKEKLKEKISDKVNSMFGEEASDLFKGLTF
jgi:hypothetical protein